MYLSSIISLSLLSLTGQFIVLPTTVKDMIPTDVNQCAAMGIQEMDIPATVCS